MYTIICTRYTASENVPHFSDDCHGQLHRAVDTVSLCPQSHIFLKQAWFRVH